MTIYSVYISPNVSEEVYGHILTELQDNITDKGDRIVVGGDFNAKSSLWGSVREDDRGRLLEEWAATMNLTPVNTGDTPTFQRGASHSVIDVTFATEKVCREITSWSVLEEETGSLHNYITYKICSPDECRNRERVMKRSFCPRRFARIVDRDFGRRKTPMEPASLGDLLLRWQTASSDRIRTDLHGNNVYWWTEEIQALRASSLTLRRRLTRRCARHSDERGIEIARQDYSAARRALKRAIARSKAKCWERLYDDLEKDIWGEGYRILTRTLKQCAPKVELERKRRIEIAEALFAAGEAVGWDHLPLGNERPDRVTAAETLVAAARLKSNRAPGPDYILPEAVKITVQKQPAAVAECLDELLQAGRFPAE